MISVGKIGYRDGVDGLKAVEVWRWMNFRQNNRRSASAAAEIVRWRLPKPERPSKPEAPHAA